MSTTVDDVPRLTADGTRTAIESNVPAAAGAALCLLLAVAQVAFAGYQLGAGNQPIQVAFLKHWANPALYATDEMLRQTLPLYPTYFFRVLAPLLNVAGLEPLYLMLQILTSFFTLAAVYFLGRSIFKSHTAALVAAGLLVAGHHRALAGEWLYTAWFTHTLVALPLALVALALIYRGRIVLAFAVAGFLFNIHALTAAYAILMMGLAILPDLREVPWKKWLRTTAIAAVACLLLAAPTLVHMLVSMKASGQVFDAAWLNLMRIRSADHSFPNTWWEAPNPDIPRFLLIFALFVLSWSFSPVRRGDTTRTLRVTIFMTIAVGILFGLGYLFSEIWPKALFIRLQPFRASRLLFVLMLVHIAYGAVEAIRSSIAGRVRVPVRGNEQESWQTLNPAARVLEILAGVFVLLTLGAPTLISLLPYTIVAVVIAALASARLSPMQALAAVGSLVVAILANRHIQFPIPLLSDKVSLLPSRWVEDSLFYLMLAAAAVAAILIALWKKPIPRLAVVGLVLVLGSAGTWILFDRNGRPGAARVNPQLAAVADWARTKTPSDALFLAPTTVSGFRMVAERGLVADWRDGTQLYFSAKFGPEWLARLNAVEPGLLLSPDGSRLVARGRSLETLDDEELLNLAKKYNATYILLPTPPKNSPRSLAVAYADSFFTAFLPKLAVTPIPIPEGVINPAEWTAMEKFMGTTVAQNIEKNRKANVTLQIVDAAGRPVQDLAVTLDQKSHAFLFGASLSFFAENHTDPLGDQKAPPVTPQELELFPTLFNASMIPFAGKWMYIEPEEGREEFAEIDRYMAYCKKHNIAVEYHFLSGLLPKFLRAKNVKPSAAERFPAHARKVVERYHDQVAFWQVTNDAGFLPAVAPVMKELREKYPGIKLGVSHCMRFYSDRKDARGREQQLFNGIGTLTYLKSQGAMPDFFAMHGHYPIGLWADPRTMYASFDRLQTEGVKAHVSEMLLPVDGEIAGPVRKGKWTPELQADFYERFLSVCFSHPNVELVNLWGIAPKGWGGSGGLLDDALKPRPAFHSLKKLFVETWHTKVDSHLPLDGTLNTRAFHGNYTLTLTLQNGKKVTTTLSVPQTPTAVYKYALDPVAGTLTALVTPPPPKPTVYPPATTGPAPAAPPPPVGPSRPMRPRPPIPAPTTARAVSPASQPATTPAQK
jgi:uncharacterized membrane protein